MLRPVTVQGLLTQVPVMPLGLLVAVKPVIALPPLPPAVKLIEAWPLPAVAVPMVGALGTVAGVTALDAADAGLLPTALVANTVKV